MKEPGNAFFLVAAMGIVACGGEGATEPDGLDGSSGSEGSVLAGSGGDAVEQCTELEFTEIETTETPVLYESPPEAEGGVLAVGTYERASTELFIEPDAFESRRVMCEDTAPKEHQYGPRRTSLRVSRADDGRFRIESAVRRGDDVFRWSETVELDDTQTILVPVDGMTCSYSRVDGKESVNFSDPPHSIFGTGNELYAGFTAMDDALTTIEWAALVGHDIPCRRVQRFTRR